VSLVEWSRPVVRYLARLSRVVTIMKHSALLLVLLAGGFLNVLAGDVQVYLIDSPQLKFLQTPKDGLRLTPGGVSGTVASLLALLPPLRTSPQQLQAVRTLHPSSPAFLLILTLLKRFLQTPNDGLCLTLGLYLTL
jgi:hypothetical protein